MQPLQFRKITRQNSIDRVLTNSPHRNWNCSTPSYLQLNSPVVPGRWTLTWGVQAIFYVLTTGCAWYLMPKDYPPYSTVYYYFRQWRDDGTWKRIHDHLVQWVRVSENHPATPSVGSLDSQSVPTAVMADEVVGTMRARKSKVASALRWWTPLAC